MIIIGFSYLIFNQRKFSGSVYILTYFWTVFFYLQIFKSIMPRRVFKQNNFLEKGKALYIQHHEFRSGKEVAFSEKVRNPSFQQNKIRCKFFIFFCIKKSIDVSRPEGGIKHTIKFLHIQSHPARSYGGFNISRVFFMRPESITIWLEVTCKLCYIA